MARDMNFKQSTLGDILDSEREMVLRAHERYGSIYHHAQKFTSLLNTGFIKSIHPDRYLFGMFMATIKKHHSLALFSVLRLHHVQGMMDIRQVLEAGACAAYAIANLDKEDFVDVNEDGTLDPSQKLTKKRYDWLDQHFKAGSDGIKRLKDVINSSTAHANLVSAHSNFRAEFEAGRFSTPYFDIEDEEMVKTDLWLTANIIMGVMDLLYGVDAKFNGFVIQPGWKDKFLKLNQENVKIKAEMMNHERLKRFMKS